MVLHNFMNRGLVQKGVLAVSLLTVVGITFAPPTHALLGVQVPLADTPATPLIQHVHPITSSLPVTLQNTPDTLGIDAPVIPVHVEATLPVSQVTRPVTNVLSPVTGSAVPPSKISSAPRGQSPSLVLASADMNVTLQTANSTKQPAKVTQQSAAKSPFAAIGGFLANFPSVLSSLASGLAGKHVGTPAIIISSLIFLLTILAISGIGYIASHGGVLAFAGYRFTILNEVSDRTQIASFAIVTLSLGVIASLLTLTTL
jgi:hypothetical protein